MGLMPMHGGQKCWRMAIRSTRALCLCLDIRGIIESTVVSARCPLFFMTIVKALVLYYSQDFNAFTASQNAMSILPVRKRLASSDVQRS